MSRNSYFATFLGVFIAKSLLSPGFSPMLVHQHTHPNFQLPTPPNHHLTQLQNFAPNLISPKLSISPNYHKTYPAAQNCPKSLIHNFSTLISINKTLTEISPVKKLSTIKNPPLILVNKICPLLDKNCRYDIKSYQHFIHIVIHNRPKHNKSTPG